MMKSRISKFFVSVSFLMLLFTTVSATFAMTVRPAPNSEEVPVMRFLSPKDGELVNGELELLVFVPQTVEVKGSVPRQVSLYIDGKYAGNMTYTNTGVYAAKWNTLRHRDGQHVLTAIAQGSGEVGSRIQITVEVLNDIEG